MHFTKDVPKNALSRPLLFKAILAFAAIHLSGTKAPSMRTIAEKYHSDCISQLISLNERDVLSEEGCVLAAVCLLRSYEILAEDFDPNRHLNGAYALAATGSLARDMPSLRRAGFFNYLREDITFSLMNTCKLKIDLNDVSIPDQEMSDEDTLNIATIHLGNTINLMFQPDPSQRDAKRALDCLETWTPSLPAHFWPYHETLIDDAPSTFPTIRMLQNCHTAVAQYNLVSTSILSTHEVAPSKYGRRLHANAVKVCGLAFTSNSAAVIVNSFGPISYCCRFLCGDGLRLELVRRLQACRKETGWPVHRMIEDLQQHWASGGHVFET